MIRIKHFTYIFYILIFTACSTNHPEQTIYDKNGHKLMTTNFVNGLQEGKQIAYYPNGKVMIEYNYVNGQREGIATSYNIDGTTQKSVLYKHGKVIKQIK